MEPTAAHPTTLSSLDASFEKILSLESATGTARASVHEALLNLLQSRSELSTSGAMLSAATRAAMGKRAIAQLEHSKGLLEMVSETAAQVRGGASALRDEVRDALGARDKAVAAAVEAEARGASALERAEAESAANVLATNEITERAKQDAAAANVRADAAELRAEQAERGFTEAERARQVAAHELHAAHEARDAATERCAMVEAQLTREREVLARVMAENVTFVKKVRRRARSSLSLFSLLCLSLARAVPAFISALCRAALTCTARLPAL